MYAVYIRHTFYIFNTDFNDDIHNGGSEETAALDFADNAAAGNYVRLINYVFLMYISLFVPVCLPLCLSVCLTPCVCIQTSVHIVPYNRQYRYLTPHSGKIHKKSPNFSDFKYQFTFYYTIVNIDEDFHVTVCFILVHDKIYLTTVHNKLN